MQTLSMDVSLPPSQFTEGRPNAWMMLFTTPRGDSSVNHSVPTRMADAMTGTNSELFTKLPNLLWNSSAMTAASTSEPAVCSGTVITVKTTVFFSEART